MSAGLPEIEGGEGKVPGYYKSPCDSGDRHIRGPGSWIRADDPPTLPSPGAPTRERAAYGFGRFPRQDIQDCESPLPSLHKDSVRRGPPLSGLVGGIVGVRTRWCSRSSIPPRPVACPSASLPPPLHEDDGLFPPPATPAGCKTWEQPRNGHRRSRTTPGWRYHERLGPISASPSVSPKYSIEIQPHDSYFLYAVRNHAMPRPPRASPKMHPGHPVR